MLSISGLQETNEFAHVKLSEELIYIKNISCDLKTRIKFQREKKMEKGNSWCYTQEGRKWLQLYDILDFLLEAISSAQLNNDGIPKLDDKHYVFPAPRNFSIPTLFFAARSLTALIFSLKAKMILVHKVSLEPNFGLDHDELTCISPDFTDLVLLAEKTEEDLNEIYRWEGTFKELAEVEDSAVKQG